MINFVEKTVGFIDPPGQRRPQPVAATWSGPMPGCWICSAPTRITSMRWVPSADVMAVEVSAALRCLNCGWSHEVSRTISDRGMLDPTPKYEAIGRLLTEILVDCPVPGDIVLRRWRPRPLRQQIEVLRDPNEKPPANAGADPVTIGAAFMELIGAAFMELPIRPTLVTWNGLRFYLVQVHITTDVVIDAEGKRVSGGDPVPVEYRKTEITSGDLDEVSASVDGLLVEATALMASAQKAFDRPAQGREARRGFLYADRTVPVAVIDEDGQFATDEDLARALAALRQELYRPVSEERLSLILGTARVAEFERLNGRGEGRARGRFTWIFESADGLRLEETHDSAPTSRTIVRALMQKFDARPGEGELDTAALSVTTREYRAVEMRGRVVTFREVLERPRGGR